MGQSPSGYSLSKKDSWFLWEQDFSEGKRKLSGGLYVCVGNYIIKTLLHVAYEIYSFYLAQSGVFGNAWKFWICVRIGMSQNRWLHEGSTNRWILPVISPFPPNMSGAYQFCTTPPNLPLPSTIPSSLSFAYLKPTHPLRPKSKFPFSKKSEVPSLCALKWSLLLQKNFAYY